MLTPSPPICFFGTYQRERMTRVAVLLEGLRDQGFPIVECQVAPGVDSSVRVKTLRNPVALGRFLYATIGAWKMLWTKARRLPVPSAVLVPYMGHFDVHLARFLFPKQLLVLDHLIFAAETATDRRANPLLAYLLRGIDSLALRAADIVIVDTEEHRQLVPDKWRHKAVVTPVGAPSRWFIAPPEIPSAPLPPPSPLRIAFLGQYIPLQGVQFIAEAFLIMKEKNLDFQATMIGTGQDYEAVRRMLVGIEEIHWIDWLESDALLAEVKKHDVCLGIFGTSKKAWRVVPQKLFLGAAAGCAIVTSDTPPQRRCFGDAAIFAAAGDAHALARQLMKLASDRNLVDSFRTSALKLANAQFQPAQVTKQLAERLQHHMPDNRRSCSHH